MKEEAERRKRAIEDKAEQLKRKSAEEDKVSKIDAEIKLKIAGMTVVDETISEGNKKLQIAVRQKCISRSEIQKPSRKSKWYCKGNRHFSMKFQSLKANEI